jgi:CheY-like chemotaxis protein
LPDIDGSQICLSLRQTLKKTAMIAITANTDRATRKKAALFGFDAFIAKPIAVDDLLMTVQRFATSKENEDCRDLYVKSSIVSIADPNRKTEQT